MQFFLFTYLFTCFIHFLVVGRSQFVAIYILGIIRNRSNMVPLIIFIIPVFTVSFLLKMYRMLFITKVDVKDKVVLVTGASGGLGEGESP